jgi:hypothetical protein
MIIQLCNSMADTQGIGQRISRRSRAARPGPGDPIISAAVSVAPICKVSGGHLILPISVGPKLQPIPPVLVALILWLKHEISGTPSGLPVQPIWRSDSGTSQYILVFCPSGLWPSGAPKLNPHGTSVFLHNHWLTFACILLQLV